MSRQIYEEALADIKSLKQIAEDNAKKTLIDAVTPRIREFIESQLLEYSSAALEADAEEDFESDEKDLPSEETLGHPGSVEPKGHLMTDGETMLDGTLGLPDEEGKITLDLVDFDSLINSDEDFDTLDTPAELPDEDEYVLSMESANSISLRSQKKIFDKLVESMKKVSVEISTLFNASKTLRESRVYTVHIDTVKRNLSEMYKILDNLHIDFNLKTKFESKLDTYSNKLNKLQENSKMKRRLFKEEDLTLKLTGLPDEVDFDDIGVDLVLDDEGSEGDEDEGDEDVSFDVESDEDSDMDSEDMGDSEDEDLEIDFGDEDDDEPKMESKRSKKDVVLEIDESILAREIKRMKRLREARARIAETKTRQSRRKGMKESLDEKMLELEVDSDMEMESADEEEMMRDRHAESREARIDRLKNERSTRFAENTEATKLRKKLSESNLFNTKLIYANKVLQNENLSNKQKAVIIEKLDQAKTPREAKIVFESTVKVMSGQARPMKESVERKSAGSASRPTRSSSATLSENVEANRWAVLAGIR